MAISEACQLWIEQRIEEELEERPKTNKSLKAIGEQLASEILKIFQVKVNSDTLRIRAMRTATKKQAECTNVHPQSIPQEYNEITENQVSELQHGGHREGAGRPAKYREDSDALFNLKRWWKKAAKKDRKAFLIWVKEENK